MHSTAQISSKPSKKSPALSNKLGGGVRAGPCVGRHFCCGVQCVAGSKLKKHILHEKTNFGSVESTGGLIVVCKMPSLRFISRKSGILKVASPFFFFPKSCFFLAPVRFACCSFFNGCFCRISHGRNPALATAGKSFFLNPVRRRSACVLKTSCNIFHIQFENGKTCRLPVKPKSVSCKPKPIKFKS